MKTGLLKLAKNSFANIANNGSNAILALVLPYFLVRHLSHLAFSVWVLVLQLAAYVNYLNLGLQLAIGRYVAYAVARDDRRQAEDVLGAGLHVLGLLAVVGIVFVLTVAGSFPALFRSSGPEATHLARPVLIFVGTAIALALPFNAFSAVFVGHQRNEVPAIIALGSRTLLGIAIAVTAIFTGDVLRASQAYLFVMLCTFLVQFIVFSRAFPAWRMRLLHNYGDTYGELLKFSASLAVMTIGMLLINGLGAAIVGMFDFRAIAAFGVATSAALILPGLLQAVTGPLVQIFVRRHARHEIGELLTMLEIASSAATIVGIALGSWMAAAGRFVFTFWIGAHLADQALPIFYILVAAQAARLTTTVSTIYFIATAKESYVLLTPIAEGTTNLIVSLIAVRYFGALGVAFAMIVGAVVGTSVNLLYNVPRTTPADYPVMRLVWANLALPVMWTAPLLAVTVASAIERLSAGWTTSLMIIATSPLCYYIWTTFRPMWRAARPVPTA